MIVPAGAPNPHGRRSATARSSEITVPRKPKTISGPCSSTRFARPCGRLQPSRSSPAQTPQKSEAIPSASSGKRTRAIMLFYTIPVMFFADEAAVRRALLGVDH